jgi:hypothetical protein
MKLPALGDGAAVRAQIAAIVSTVASHPKADPTSVRARLHAGQAEQPKVEVQARLTTTSWDEFLAIQQEIDLLLRDTLAAGAAPQDGGGQARDNVYRLDAEAESR